jgi:hypothetical protein
VKLVVLVLLLPACGGSPFTMAVPIPAEAADASPNEAAPTMVGQPDAASTGDTGEEAETVSETTAPEAAMPEAACVLAPASLCGGYNVHPPFTLCTERQGAMFISTALAPCNTCETYTCACILNVIGCSRPTCAEKGGQVLVTCE